MKPLLILLLIAGTVHAQSIADVARKERERQANLKPVRVITSTETKVEEPKPAATPEDQAKTAKTDDAKAKAAQTSTDSSKQADATKTVAPKVDPVEAWNKQVDQLRTKIRTLQDQGLALQLQLNQANNQVYSPVTDQATQDRALALVAQIQNAIVEAGKQLDDAKKTLDGMLLQGPPKK